MISLSVCLFSWVSLDKVFMNRFEGVKEVLEKNN